MQLGFFSAILPDLPLEKVVEVAADGGLDCVEVACWPSGKASRRYAGITHIDVASLKDAELARIRKLLARTKVAISALGYYPNPLAPDPAESRAAVEHLVRVIDAAAKLGLRNVNSFVGRDWSRTIDANWPRFLDTWKPIIAHAEKRDVRIGIENCPMYFTHDEWPGGKNLAISPAVWRRMFADIPSRHFGLNYDPSHFVWQQMDPLRPLTEFADRLFHLHAKDVRVDRARLDEVGILAPPNDYHRPKLPGLGDIDWSRFFSVLTDSGYDGAVCVEVEDRAYEKTLATRLAAITQSTAYLRNFIRT
jgi:sugar phosphate isomerase/epimerase